eukprot:4138017-Prymnesium_polylepis.1
MIIRQQQASTSIVDPSIIDQHHRRATATSIGCQHWLPASSTWAIHEHASSHHRRTYTPSRLSSRATPQAPVP